MLDDTEMVACMHYVLVDPEYQGHGLAGHLVGMVKERYRDYLYIEVMPEESKNATFYQKHGFSSMEDGAAMQICNPGERRCSKHRDASNLIDPRLMTGVLLFRVSANTSEGWPEYLVISYPLCGLFPARSTIYRRDISGQVHESAIYNADTCIGGILSMLPVDGGQRLRRCAVSGAKEVYAPWQLTAVT